jgi:hypothetical protein
MRTDLVRWLRAFALWARDEILRLQREMTAALALRGMRGPFLGLTCQSVCSFESGTDEGGKQPRRSERGLPLIVWVGRPGGSPRLTLVAVGVKVAQLFQHGKALVDRVLVPVRMKVEVLAAFIAESLAIRTAERGERSGQE